MRRVGRAFGAYFRAATAVMLQYRGEIVLWAVWGLVNPAVLYAMWSSAAESNAGGTVVGLTAGEIAAYYFVIMIVGHFTTAWDAYEMGYLVRTGQLSPMLLRPILPIWQAIANNLAYKATTLVFVVPMWALFAWIVKPTFHPAAWQLTLGAVALVLAAVLNFILGYVVALIAFWAVKLDAVGEVYFGLSMFLGGRFAPIAALPHPINLAADALPFRWVYAFPTELLIGKGASAGAGAPVVIGLSEALAGIAIQIAWIVGTIIGFRILWAAAVKRYTAVSG
jgi:ABC-2 type transport system permease protein